MTAVERRDPMSVRRIVLVGLGLALALAGLAGWWVALAPLPTPVGSTADATRIYDRHGVLLYEILDADDAKRATVPLSEAPLALRQATLAAEDATFYRNPGVEPRAIARAFLANLRRREIVMGGSTITQQVVRNLYVSPEERAAHSLWRKVREAALALRLTARLSKDEILALYLNHAPYGSLAYGVEAAARTYFGKHVRDLDLAESALLAGLPQAPGAYDPLVNPDAARRRQGVVLDLMVRNGSITPEQAETARGERLRFARHAFPMRAPHFVTYVIDLLEERLGRDALRRGGRRVYTTLDLGLQEIAEAAIRRQVRATADRDLSSAALVALDPATGEILAMVGSADYDDPSIDGAVNVALALRQPGSSLKPFAYAAALERGLTPATVLADVPTTFSTRRGLYSPENYDRRYRGPVSLRAALANSYNVPAVRLVEQIGVPSFLAVADRVGLATLRRQEGDDLSLVLGSGEVRLVDLAAAYGALAAGGLYSPPRAILRIESGGRSTAEIDDGAAGASTRPTAAGTRPPSPRRALSEQVAYLVTHILADDGARAPTFGRGSPLEIGRPAAVKTGTTTDWRDNWTVGYTPELVVGVWAGNADNRPTRELAGAIGAAPIWHEFMAEALQGKAPTTFREPPGIVRRDVCASTGLLPSPLCPATLRELFIAGTEPTRTDTVYVAARICPRSGLPASADCPANEAVERVYEDWSGDLRDWARARGLLPPVVADSDAPPPRSAVGQASPLSGHTAAGPPAASRGADPVLGTQRSVRVTSPVDGALFEIDPTLPADVQRLELTASVADGLRRVEFYVDGRRLGTLTAPPYRALWPIAPGKHRIWALAEAPDGQREEGPRVEITVTGGGS